MIPTASAIKVRAMQLAKERVRDMIRRSGKKVSSFTAAELTRWAERYIEQSPWVVAQARQEVEQWKREGFFGKRIQRETLAQG